MDDWIRDHQGVMMDPKQTPSPQPAQHHQQSQPQPNPQSGQPSPPLLPSGVHSGEDGLHHQGSVTSAMAIIQAAAAAAANNHHNQEPYPNNFVHDFAIQQHVIQIKQQQLIQQQILEQQFQRNRDMLQAEHDRQMAVILTQAS